MIVIAFPVVSDAQTVRSEPRWDPRFLRIVEMRQAELLNASVTDHVSGEGTDFTLVLGGPLYQLYLRTKLVRPALELVPRRVAFISLLCWMPLLVLTLFAGHALHGVAVPFLLDLGVYTRFAVALPLL